MIAANLKALRRQRNLTQAQFAESVGLKRSLVGAYEEGRAEPKLSTLVTFARFFDLTVDQFATLDLSAGRPPQPVATPETGPRVLAITVDRTDGDENIELVPLRAAAGYLNGYADPEFVAELPRFRLPLAAVRDGSHRAFEINGDSMLPLQSGTVVVGRYLTDPARDVRDGAPCVVVSGTEGIVFKRVYRAGKKNGQAVLELRSDNPAYEPYTIPAAEVRELWEARAYLSTAFPAAPGGGTPEAGAALSAVEMTTLLRDLQREMRALKSK